MPPSPALRFSPRELNHKRGRSLEGGLSFKERDEDLTLFNNMETRERDNFLLQSSDDLDDSLSTKLKYFSDIKLGISIPARGVSSDLLDIDGEKNDYDWLLTPPDSPLFPSLDDEPPPVNLVHRGRPRSQPVSISRTSMTAMSSNSRSSASPHRLSPSPRSGSSTFRSQGRPSSAPHTSPNPFLRPSTPSRRPSNPSTATPRSSTPTPRRMSTGSSVNPCSFSRTGTSPGKTARGNSASPKLRAWQSTLPGFSSDPPPNLRTSLSDRPASNVRGLSPTSRNGRDSSNTKFGRQSMSPTASRSASSSHSHDRDQLSSHSKGSVGSFGDEDMDSLQSVPVVSMDRHTLRKNGSVTSSKHTGLSKKPSKTLSASSAPQRSFDNALRQMNHRKGPQKMFRPLLSSVPSTTFYVGKANTMNRPMISRNSSVTTSSNASSELGASVVPNTEGSDHDQDDLTSKWQKIHCRDAHEEEVFILDKEDEKNVSMCGEEGKPSNDGHGECDGCTKNQVDAREQENLSCNHTVNPCAETNEPYLVVGDPLEAGCGEMVALCSICGNKFRIINIKSTDGDMNVCPNCTEKCGSSASIIQNHSTLGKALQENKVDTKTVVELPKQICNDGMICQNTGDVEQGYVPMADVYVECQKFVVDPQVADPRDVGFILSDSNIANHPIQCSNLHPSLTVDGSEGTGISVLLKRSSSSKWPVIQGRVFTATNIPCDNPTYVRDSLNSLRTYSAPGSASTSSSIDFSALPLTEGRVQRQLSSRKIDLENYREDSHAKLLRTRSSFSGVSENADEALVLARCAVEEKVEGSARSLENEVLQKKGIITEGQERVSKDDDFDDKDPSVMSAAVLDEDKLDQSDSSRILASSASDLSSHARSIRLEDTSVLEHENGEHCDTLGSAGKDFTKNAESISNVDVTVMDAENFQVEEESTLSGRVHEIDDSSVLAHDTVMALGELEDCSESTRVSHTESATSPCSNNVLEASEEHLASSTGKDLSVSALDDDIIEQGHDINEEARVAIDCQRGQKSRSLTLEEATDTILFCSSIIHNLAYEAATIAMGKEEPVVPFEISRPTVTILGLGSGRNDPHGRTCTKRTPKSQKSRHKRSESNTMMPSTKVEDDARGEDPLAPYPDTPHKVDSMKPPKLESKCNCSVM